MAPVFLIPAYVLFVAVVEVPIIGLRATMLIHAGCLTALAVGFVIATAVADNLGL